MAEQSLGVPEITVVLLLGALDQIKKKYYDLTSRLIFEIDRIIFYCLVKFQINHR